MRRVPRSLRWLGILGIGVLALWAGGLAFFAVDSLRLQADREAKTDAVIVLTGGRQRLETGLDLLTDGSAGKLFISGVNQRVEREALLHVLGPAARERAACCIALGHEADNTLENAWESAGWMQEEGYRSLRLVTSWYHMQRSLLEFGRAMPRVVIVAHPVAVQSYEWQHWWSWHGVPWLLFSEYNKYLAAWSRPFLDALFPSRHHGLPPSRSTGSGRELAARAPR